MVSLSLRSAAVTVPPTPPPPGQMRMSGSVCRQASQTGMWVCRNFHLGSNFHMSIAGPSRTLSAPACFPSTADTRVVSRNCTEDGWSEPFPHYLDACGFDDYEYETGDQVGVCAPPRGHGGGAGRQAQGFCHRGCDPWWDHTYEHRSAPKPDAAALPLTPSGLRSSWFAA